MDTLKGLEKLNKAQQSSLIIYITVEPNPRQKGEFPTKEYNVGPCKIIKKPHRIRKVSDFTCPSNTPVNNPSSSIHAPNVHSPVIGTRKPFPHLECNAIVCSRPSHTRARPETTPFPHEELNGAICIMAFSPSDKNRMLELFHLILLPYVHFNLSPSQMFDPLFHKLQSLAVRFRASSLSMYKK